MGLGLENFALEGLELEDRGPEGLAPENLFSEGRGPEGRFSEGRRAAGLGRGIGVWTMADLAGVSCISSRFPTRT